MNTLKNSLIAVLLISASSATSTTFADSRFSCNTLKLQNATPFIENIIDRILTIGKIHQQYNICRLPKSSNAAAVIYKKRRIIAYDSVFLATLAGQSGEQHWGNVTVLAHEIGHHILGHTDRLPYLQRLPTMKRLALQRQFELQADQFAGKVLANMGASLSSTQAVIGLLKIHQNEVLSTHPDMNKRVEAVKKGWNEGCRQAGSNCNSSKYKHKARHINIKSPLGRAATANCSRFMRQAEKLKGVRVNRNYCNLYAVLAVNQTNRSLQYKCGFNVGTYASPWNRTVKPQSDWCMQASAYATSKEAKFRETKLASCLAKSQRFVRQQAINSPVSGNATPNYARFIQLSKTLKSKPVTRAYCNLYASLATQQTKRNKQYHCGFEIADKVNRWSSAFMPQSNWCMTTRASIPAGEATVRERKLAACIH